MPKTQELHYSQQTDGLVDGRIYANPRFFSGPRESVKKVFIDGEWPEIEAAYRALDVPVERIDPLATVIAEDHRSPIKTPTANDAASVDIPADWRDLKWSRPNASGLTLRALASMVSAGPVTNGDQAAAAIEAEIQRRAASSEIEPNGEAPPAD